MAKLIWGNPTDRTYQTGVDQGVLYINGAGYAWNGLMKVTESTSPGEPREHYVDGFKYLAFAGLEDFEATVEAMSAPREFSECDGYGSLGNGLIVSQQPHKAFDFSYRTLLGDAAVGEKLGYQIHIVYNAVAIRESYEAVSIGDQATPSINTWNITTRPVKVPHKRQTSHFIVDSRFTPSDILITLSERMYGGPSTDANLPTPSELMSMFGYTG